MERVLIVDDEPECRYALADLLESKGFDADTAENAEAALKRVHRDPSSYGLVYTDMLMPGVGGLELVALLSNLDPTIVTIVMTGQTDSRNAIAAMRSGAFDYLTKPYTFAELEMSLARAMERRNMLLQHEHERARLTRLVEENERERRKMFVSSVRAHARSIEAKDAYTAGHCDRVARFAELLARLRGGFDETWLFNLKVASILHDIGKIGVRSAVLCKPGALNTDETAEIRTHSEIGANIVRTIYGLSLERAVRHHHERFDGTGYPDRLKGADIPLESRIIFIADTFDAMTSDRPYRRALSTEEGMREIQQQAGSQFDPALVDIAVKAASHFEAARIEMARQPRGDYFIRV